MVAIRPATDADAEPLVALINQAFRVERFFIGGDRISAGGLRSLLTRGTVLIGEESGRMRAAVYVEPRGRRGYFGMLSVDPSHQHGGWGRRMIDAAEAHLRHAGCTEVDIRVVSLREDLAPFYARFGYVETGIEPFTDARPHRPCHLIVMTKTL
jgi:GNAT superfamily N-acetyltransferase